MNVRVQEGLHAGTFLYHIGDGLYYHFSYSTEKAIYLKCVFSGRGCSGRAVLRDDDIFYHTQGHSHSSDVLYEHELILRRQILNTAAENFVSFRSIVNSERLSVHPFIASRVTLRRMRPAMFRERMKKYPDIPVSVSQLAAYLNDPTYSTLAHTVDEVDNLYASSVTDPAGLSHILFASRRMLNFMSTCNVLFLDGTFKATPSIPGLYQVLCITTIWRSHVIPLAWVLMSSKTQEAYESVLQQFHQLMGTHSLEKMITDFEIALQNACFNVFQVPVQGCYFHFVWDNIKYAFSIGLKVPLQLNSDLKKIVSWCCVLPLLPDEFIELGFFIIGRDTMQYLPTLYPILTDYFLYVNNTWITNNSRRSTMCVSGSQNRTNNACECLNRWLTEEVGTPHPNIWSFINAIARIEYGSLVDMVTLENGGLPTRPRKVSYIAQDERIASLTRDLYNAPDNVVSAVTRFLNGATHSLDGLVDRVIAD